MLFGVTGKRCLTWTKPRSCVKRKEKTPQKKQNKKTKTQALDCSGQFVQHCINFSSGFVLKDRGGRGGGGLAAC